MAGERILIVEDNAKNMKLVRDVLEHHGYGDRRRGHGRGRAGAVARRASRPDPDGHRASRHGRVRGAEAPQSRQRTAAIPVCALTAFAMNDDRERCLRAGFDGYLVKPINVTGFAAGAGLLEAETGGGTVTAEAKIVVVDDTPQNVKLLEAVLYRAATR